MPLDLSIGSHITCTHPSESKKMSDLGENSRNWLAQPGMHTKRPYDMVFTLTNGNSNNGVILIDLADTYSLKHSAELVKVAGVAPTELQELGGGSQS